MVIHVVGRFGPWLEADANDADSSQPNRSGIVGVEGAVKANDLLPNKRTISQEDSSRPYPRFLQDYIDCSGQVGLGQDALNQSVAYWERMVAVTTDARSQLLELLDRQCQVNGTPSPVPFENPIAAR